MHIPGLNKSKKQKPDTGRAALVFDFGSGSVKILACRYFGDRVQIVAGAKAGYPKEVFDAEGELRSEPLAEAIKTALPAVLPAVAEENPVAVVGLGGLNVEGYASQINYRRARKDKAIDQREFLFMLKRIEERAGQIITSMVDWETGAGHGAAIINSEILDLSLDGYTVDSPVGLRGETLTCVVYNAYASQRALAAINQAVKISGYRMFSITATMYATLRAVLARYGQGPSLAVLDVGGNMTEVGVIRGGKIIGHKSFDVAGQSFTDAIADEAGCSLPDAEILKLGFAAAKLESKEMKDIREAVAAGCKVFTNGVELVLKEFPGFHNMPERLLLLGGGSLLPGVLSCLQSEKPGGKKRVRADLLLPKEFGDFQDLTGQLNSAADVASLALAVDAVDLIRDSNLSSGKWTGFLKK